MAQGVSLSNWAEDNFDHSGLGFIGGGSIFFNHENPIAAAALETYAAAPTWGSRWKRFVHQNADRWVPAYIQCNSLPYEKYAASISIRLRKILWATRYVELPPGPKRTSRGFNLLRTRRGGSGRGRHRRRQDLHWRHRRFQPAVGGTRMGDNPETNVVNKWGFSHEAPNLGILGGSVLGTHGARNPTQTIQALAWRTAEHLVKNWKSIAG